MILYALNGSRAKPPSNLTAFLFTRSKHTKFAQNKAWKETNTRIEALAVYQYHDPQFPNSIHDQMTHSLAFASGLVARIMLFRP